MPRKKYFVDMFDDYRRIGTGFAHQTGGSDWPFIGSAVIDINDRVHIFLGGGDGQPDALLTYDLKTNKFIDIISETGINPPPSKKKATYSAVSFDINNNGKEDLIVGRADGVIIYMQMTNGKFIPYKFFSIGERVPLSISVSDFNKNGLPDIYISCFIPNSKYRGTIFNDPSHDRQNILLKNTSVGNTISFEDVTEQTKTGGTHNTFTSAFVDLNNNGYPDIVLSHDSGEIEILRNIGGEQFESIRPFPYKGNWMGIGVGDINGNGFQDLFFTNIGTLTDKTELSLGDIKPGQKQTFSHVLLKNNGDYTFEDITKEKGISGNGFGWGAIIDDLSLSGRVDILFAEGFMLDPVQWVYPGIGYYYTQMPDGKFQREFKYQNANFAQTPILADFNGDGINEVVWVNMQGPTQVYFNENTSGNNFVSIKIPRNIEFTNSKIILDTGSKKMHKEMINGGVGFGSGQSNVITFGLGTSTEVKSLTIRTIYGDVYQIKNLRINKLLSVFD